MGLPGNRETMGFSLPKLPPTLRPNDPSQHPHPAPPGVRLSPPLPMKKVRILIADDHDIVRRGLKPLLESEWGWEVCGEVANGQQAVALAGKLRPDIVVMDAWMPEMNGMEATRLIKAALPETEIVAFTGTESGTLVQQFFAAGARACFLKSEAGVHLIPAIKALVEHQPDLTARASQVVLSGYLQGGKRPDPASLNLREREIMQLLADGKSNKEVAARLDLTVKAAESQRAAIMRQLGLTAFSEMVRDAVRNQLVEP